MLKALAGILDENRLVVWKTENQEGPKLVRFVAVGDKTTGS